GRCSEKEKNKAVQQFQNNRKIRLFIGNIKAAGVGITLTAASDVLTCDFSYTPNDHYQAEDRVCRIGQTANSVTAYYMYLKNSIDAKMVKILNEKADVAKRVVDGETVVEADLFLTDYGKDAYRPKKPFTWRGFLGDWKVNYEEKLWVFPKFLGYVVLNTLLFMILPFWMGGSSIIIGSWMEATND
ncbi:MAG: SWF/SNF helicase family protein, partial [Mucispirillum sp.]|nr:SWF/SNF helicase family protein [Mucispirillum sp.]